MARTRMLKAREQKKVILMVLIDALIRVLFSWWTSKFCFLRRLEAILEKEITFSFEDWVQERAIFFLSQAGCKEGAM